MKPGFRLWSLLFLLPAMTAVAICQGYSTDQRKLELFAFGGATGVYTGLDGGRNLGLTAGVDVGFITYRGFLPTIEVRGTYPVDNGAVVGERNFLGGLKVERPYGKLHPYVDILFGRGGLTYNGRGLLNLSETVLYQKTNSNVYAPGAGLDFDITPSLAIKGDFQLEHYDTPVTTNGNIDSKAITVGVVYRFGYRQQHPS